MSSDSSDDEGDHILGGLLDSVNAVLTQVDGLLRDLITTLTRPLTVTGRRVWETVRTPWELRERGQQRLPADTYTRVAPTSPSPAARPVSPTLPSSAARPPAGYRDTEQRRRDRRRRPVVTPRAPRTVRIRGSPSEYEPEDWEGDNYDYVGLRGGVLKEDAEDRKKKLAELRF